MATLSFVETAGVTTLVDSASLFFASSDCCRALAARATIMVASLSNSIEECVVSEIDGAPSPVRMDEVMLSVQLLGVLGGAEDEQLRVD